MRKVKINATIPENYNTILRELAKKEKRSISNMLAILIEDALVERGIISR